MTNSEQVIAKFLKNSKCLSEDEVMKKQFIVGLLKDEQVEAKMMYQASKHGWMAKDFHDRCDFLGPTITLMKLTDDGPCIGGFTKG